IRTQGLSFSLFNPESGRTLTRHISHIKPFIQRELGHENDRGISTEDKPEDDKSKPKTPRKRPRIPYTIVTRSTKRNIEEPTSETSIQETQEFRESTEAQESQKEQINEAVMNYQLALGENISTTHDPSNETVFFDCDSPTTTTDDNQSMDSNGQEVELLTNEIEEELKPRKLISPIVQRIADLHDRALDKFIKDYKCNIKKTSWSALQNKKAKKIEKINEWIRANHPDWEKDDNGYFLIKHNALMLESKCYLSLFSILELKVLAKHMGLDIETTSKPKTEILTEFKKEAKEKFPFMKSTQKGDLIIDPAHFR
ncbi:unnamed protein product, partial [Oikopleura dioica]